MKPISKDAFKLFHDGTNALARMERNGIRIDLDALHAGMKLCDDKVEWFRKRLHEDEVYRTWRKVYGSKTNIESPQQLGNIVFNVLKYPSKYKNKDGKPKADKKALEDVNIPFVRNQQRLRQWQKLKSTYLKGILRETCNGFLHPFFNLHTVITFRGSSDKINFQNVPIRDEELGPIVRRCIVPRPGHALVEIDYSALEFKIAACFWRDPKMIAYASDPTKDVHRDMAAKLYLLDIGSIDPKELKKCRFYAKNNFVFPTLYGSFWWRTAANLWDMIDRHKLTHNGMPLKKWLRKQGITRLTDLPPDTEKLPKDYQPAKGTFERHVKDVEEWFMKQFPVFAAAKEEWYRQYKEEGGFQLMTGFWSEGIYSKNDCLNYPVQGPAFHCLLWDLIEIQNYIDRYEMKSLLIGEIHDSLLGDVPEAEIQEYLNAAEFIMTKKIRKAMPWICVPMDIEVDVSHTNWAEKKEWTKQGGIWQPKAKAA